MSFVKKVIKDLSTPDNFSYNWYGYATNQISHATLGFLALSIVSFILFIILGEFAQKEVTWLIVAVLYVLWEIRSPSWDGLEDFIFFVVYGAGSASLLFNEVNPGSPVVETSIDYVPKIVLIIATHLFVGIVARVIRK